MRWIGRGRACGAQLTLAGSLTPTAIAADAAEAQAEDVLRIPFIGKPGTSRFIIGQGHSPR